MNAHLTYTSVVVANTNSAVPVALSATPLWVRGMTVQAFKTLARGANTGNVRIGTASTDSTQTFELAPGEEYVVNPGNGDLFDLGDWFLDVNTNNDAVIVTYY